MSKAFLFILAALALAGCMSVYQEPGGSGTASLKMEGPVPTGGLTFEAYADKHCQSPSSIGAAYGFGIARDLQKKIPAGREFVLTGNWVGARPAVNTFCSSTVTFVPEAGRNYVATFAVSPDERSCGVSIEERAGQGARPVSFRKNDILCSNATQIGLKQNGVALLRVYTATVSTYSSSRR